MRPLKILLSVVILLSVAFLARAEAPEPRTALIIGNADYSFAPLKNPINDADAMATALKGAGFKVIKETDADQAKMVEAVRTFSTELKQRGGVGLFYFSGHGTQIDGENYLLPVGAEFASLEDVKRGSMTALAVVDAMATGRSDLNIIILDACRNNPIDPNGAKGLSRIDSNARLFISYATSPGLTALDGAGDNSPYAKYLYQSIDAPNLDIEDTFKRTLKGVYVETHGEQTPWISSTFFGRISRVRTLRRQDAGGQLGRQVPGHHGEWADGSATETLELVANAAPGDIALSEGSYKVEGKNADGSAYEGTVEIERQGKGYHMSWEVGSSSYEGNGVLAGNLLTVEWGSPTPVVYALGTDGSLTGLWDAGKGEETLTPE